MEEKYAEPTPVQSEVVPYVLQSRDVLACAQTGTGKTAAFVLPLLQLLGARPASPHVRVLVLTPTRELAAQIDEHLRDLSVHTPISGAAVYGGVAMGPQEHAFRTIMFRRNHPTPAIHPTEAGPALSQNRAHRRPAPPASTGRVSADAAPVIRVNAVPVPPPDTPERRSCSRRTTRGRPAMSAMPPSP